MSTRPHQHRKLPAARHSQVEVRKAPHGVRIDLGRLLTLGERLVQRRLRKVRLVRLVRRREQVEHLRREVLPRDQPPPVTAPVPAEPVVVVAGVPEWTVMPAVEAALEVRVVPAVRVGRGGGPVLDAAEVAHAEALLCARARDYKMRNRVSFG